MSADKKSKSLNPDAIAKVEAETQDEIAEIMSEIEQLQAGMAAVPKTKAPSPSKLKAVPQEETTESEIEEDGLSDFHGSGDDVSLEETLGAMKEEESATGQGLLDSVVDQNLSHEEVPMPTRKNKSNEGSLSMTLTGDITLKLKYEYDGQEVTVGFTDNFLCVELSDGTEFKIPVNRGSHAKVKAA